MALPKSIFTAVLIIVSHAAYSQHPIVKNSFPKIGILNETDYVLNADRGIIKQWKDTIYYYKLKLRKCRYAIVPVTLTNQTGDTLKYIDMSCSNLDIFTTDTKDAKVFQDRECFKNNPTVLKLAPYASTTFYIPLYFFIKTTNGKQMLTLKKFKIGMGIFKDQEGTFFDQMYFSMNMIRGKDHIIWSDEINVL